jgi:hypothetical protein
MARWAALDCDGRAFSLSDLRIVTYTAAPGSPHGEGARPPRVVGTQNLV